MDLRGLAILTTCLALPISAANIGIGGRWQHAQETSVAELAEKTANGVSPVPTSPPNLGQMELFKRDYTLPSDYCGWYDDYKSDSFTCNLIGASCINIGNYRGCCSGATSICSSTFFSTCIPSSSLSSSASCGTGTACCTLSEYPECITMYFSSSAHSTDTYTMIDCYPSGYSSTYLLQDYPPYLTSTSASSSSSTSTPSTSSRSSSTTSFSSSSTSSSVTSSTSSSQPAGGGSSAPVGAIVGGVVGGVAVIGLAALGVFFLLRYRPKSQTSAPAVAPVAPVAAASPDKGGPPGPQMYQMNQAVQPGYYPTSPVNPPAYDPRYGYPQNYQVMSPNMNVAYGSPGMQPMQSPMAPMQMMPTGTDPSKVVMAGHPQEVVVTEMAAMNSLGSGTNRAEMA